MKKSIFIIAFSILFLFPVYFIIELFVPLPTDRTFNIEIKIPEGLTYSQALDIFSSEGLIRDKNVLLFMGRITGIDKRIRAGYYSIAGSIRPFDIFKMLKNGQIIEYNVTILEGDSLLEIEEKLAKKGIMSTEDFEQIATDKDFLRSFDIDAPSIEGYLFPDTYRFPKGIDPRDAIATMINKMRKEYSEELRERAAEIGLSEREVLTLASIIEKESVIDKERFLISAVFHNRLKKGIPLQSDPTAIYGIKSFKEKITLKDLRRKTKYNTYFIKGLPPGPIASPGIKSIKAALYPANVPYMYFVSNNDGTHHFSVTAEEHLAAVKSYREKKKIQEKKDQEEGKGDESS